MLAASGTRAGAQRLADLPSSTLLRVRIEGTRDWREGTLVAITPDSLALQGRSSSSPCLAARSALWRGGIAMRAARPTCSRGGAIGAIAGVVVVVVEMIHCEHGQQNDMCGVGILFVPPMAAIGFTFGAIIGALLPVERWQAVELP